MRARVIAVLAFIFSIITIIGAGAQTVLYGFVLLLAGIPVYVWLKRTSSAPAATAVVQENSDARLAALRASMAAVAFFALVALFLSERIPTKAVGAV